MEKKSLFTTRMLVEGAMMIAIATILSFIKVAEMPYGGSVTAGSMVPILVFAYRWGGVRGMFVGMVYGLIQFMINPYSAHPISVLLDYPVAFGALGTLGFFANRESGLPKIATGIIVAIGLRFVSHFLSGIIFFYMYAPEGMSPVLYSAGYNAFYLVPEMIISFGVFLLLRKPLMQVK